MYYYPTAGGVATTFAAGATAKTKMPFSAPSDEVYVIKSIGCRGGIHFRVQFPMSQVRFQGVQERYFDGREFSWVSPLPTEIVMFPGEEIFMDFLNNYAAAIFSEFEFRITIYRSAKWEGMR
ncbi:MAG: hypothetical protein M0R66_03930 [Candidatus Omnitrophica bacterium]|nr:hypothetical protein [Candidatus Omnitrophota bacterium]